MVMYFVATGRQAFSDRAHDQDLALDICNKMRPEITEKDVPKCYIDLMEKCWDPNPDNRPNAVEILESIRLFKRLKYSDNDNDKEIVKQFEEACRYKNANLLAIKNNQATTHPQAIYTTRLLNFFTTEIGWNESKNDQ